MNFIKRIDKITESVLDWPRDTLPPNIWDKIPDDTYKLKSSIKSKIINSLEFLPPDYKSNIYIIGSICSFNYNDKSDIDVHILPPENAPSKEVEEWQEEIKPLSNKVLVGQHPINYYLHDNRDYHADSMYDINNDKWIKWNPINMVNLSNYYNKFKKIIDDIDLNKAEMYRDIIDLEELRDAHTNASSTVQDQIGEEIKNKLIEINQEIENYIDTYVNLKNKRTNILATGFPGKESRSDLPENVIFLLIRRYGYDKLAKILKDLKKERNIISSPKDIGQIKDGIKENFITRISNNIKALLG